MARLHIPWTNQGQHSKGNLAVHPEMRVSEAVHCPCLANKKRDTCLNGGGSQDVRNVCVRLKKIFQSNKSQLMPHSQDVLVII